MSKKNNIQQKKYVHQLLTISILLMFSIIVIMSLVYVVSIRDLTREISYMRECNKNLTDELSYLKNNSTERNKFIIQNTHIWGFISFILSIIIIFNGFILPIFFYLYDKVFR